jgi:hypothetical protein
MWLSVRGQHPYHGPSAVSAVFLAVLILAATPEAELDPVIHLPARLRIVVTLATLPEGDSLSFPRRCGASSTRRRRSAPTDNG